PEYARGGQASVASDIYALGIMLWECLAGFRPFELRKPPDRSSARNPMEETVASLRGAAPSLGALLPGTPYGLVELISQMIANDEACRPHGAGIVLGRLEAIAAGSGAGSLSPVAEPRARTVLTARRPPDASTRRMDRSVSSDEPARAPGAPRGRGSSAAGSGRPIASALLSWPWYTALAVGLVGLVSGLVVVGLLRVSRPPEGDRGPADPTRRSPVPTVHVSVPAERPELDELEDLFAREPDLHRLRPWSEAAGALECPVVLREPPGDEPVRFTVPTNQEVVSVNGVSWPTQTALSPFRVGLNWVRVNVTAGGSVGVTVPNGRGRLSMRPAVDGEAIRELDAYERLRALLYPRPDPSGARAMIETLMPEPDHPFRRLAFTWCELAPSMSRSFGISEALSSSAAVESSPYLQPELLRLRRRYLDGLQPLIPRHGDRWYLWLGIAWQLRWGDQTDAAMSALLRALDLWPRCPWSWYELARWEFLTWQEWQMRRTLFPQRSRRHFGRAALVHFELAERFMKERRNDGIDVVVRDIQDKLGLLRKRADKE
ncbi:MAG: hypothetical protein HY815_13130, partial [Candidatus Riflebacteria bacterium]|nr:hypothetical protein [Candidatus Riflebacteria bacterium]